MSRSTSFYLFELIFLFKVFSLLSEYVFFEKLAVSFLLVKFTCFNLAVKLSDVNLLNSWVVIYLSWSLSVIILISISLIFALYSVFYN